METHPTVIKKVERTQRETKIEKRGRDRKISTLCEFLIPTLPIDFPVLYSTHLVVGQRWVELRYYALS